MTSYLDHAATTPVRPEVVDAMLPVLVDVWGNPSGAHAPARAAQEAVDEARDVVAACLGARPGEVVFTSGGTEAANLAVLGAPAGRTLCSAVEHRAVLRAVESVAGTTIPVDASGTVDLDALSSLLDHEVTLVSVMLANNEVGTVQPLADVADLVRRRAPRAVLHTDAVQAVPWLDVCGLAAVADLVSVSAHKFGGPKGVGALVARDGTALRPMLHGGGQERERRSGTPNVAGIVGMATALRLAVSEREASAVRVRALRDRLVDGLVTAVPGVRPSVPGALCLPGIAHVTVDGVESEALVLLLDEAGVFVSAGSSCASGATEPSHVLAAMGIDKRAARGALRLSLGGTTTAADVDLALAVIPDAVARLRRVAA